MRADTKSGSDPSNPKPIRYALGRTYFDKKTERTFYFVLTMSMLVFGLLVKLGIFGS